MIAKEIIVLLLEYQVARSGTTVLREYRTKAPGKFTFLKYVCARMNIVQTDASAYELIKKVKRVKRLSVNGHSNVIE